ncbi:ABC transporter substrate-binding protein [Sphingomonas sp.]|uniref:ABC transporter substrate-binding protein n=1 Tax=Sphingomonas sp. TaxID=28214 RepID=UPI0025FD5F78|nr:ABC transporter substrate-binding protein [Sphingomonas sp.]MBV9527944.1 ABC transporter substrate-binding protein [Sphingomonas sp.]
MMLRHSLLAAAAVAVALPALAEQKPLQIGMTVGSLGNPYFVAAVKGAQTEAAKINPASKVTAVSSDYDLNKQATQMDNFASAGDDLILLNAVDPRAIAPAVKRAQAQHIVVAAFDVAAQGADVTVQTDNVKAGEIACQYLAEQIGGKGDVVIVNGPQVSAVTDRVKGCEATLKKNPGIKVLSDNLDAKGSRDGGLQVMQGLLTRFPHIDGVFAINDPTAIGCDLAAKQLHRTELKIASVDGSPDIEASLKQPGSLIISSSSQDPFTMAEKAVDLGNEVVDGKKPAQTMVLLAPQLITRENVKDYKGWTSH